ncbi:MAG: glycosyltransferase family 39 protein [Chloroflexota bacterium]
MSDETQPPDQTPIQEPSVLDYLKSLFRFGKGERIQLPEFVEEEQPLAISGQPLAVSDQPATFQPSNLQTLFPWRSLLALGFALLGQKLFEPPPDTIPLGIAFYIMALSMLGWALYRGEWNLAPLGETSEGTDPLSYRRVALFISLLLALLAFTIFTDNLFTTTNVFIWLVAVALFISAFWINKNKRSSLFGNFGGIFRNGFTLNISAWMLLLIAATALVFFFRFTQTASVPPEPFSDHAEKILDVYDVSQGQTHIFFPRNTGREAIQMYWTLLVAKVFGTGLSYLSLKLGTAILGFLTLPFIYLLGKEIGGPRVALFAFILAGIGYWPNVISRIGLRFPLYPLFVAPTLLFLIRGLRTRNRNDFLLAGLFLGLGLHGYSPMRIVPFVVIAAFVLYWLHSQSKGARRDLPVWLTILALVSLVVFLPLLRYWVDHPAEFGFRAMSRLSGTEQPLPGPALEILASNVWKALKMFNFDDGEIWVNSMPHRPALDIVTGALFVIGFVLVLIRYLRKRHWLDLFLLVSIPLLQLPSSLSLAFPGENPALNRAGGAYIPAFILSALALDGLLTSFGRGKIRTVLVWGVAGLLIYSSALQNYDIVFNQFNTSFRQGAWNTSDMGKVIKEFEQNYGRTDTAWVVPFPYWVDTRLPAVWAGIPNRDMAMWPDNLASTVELTGPKLFIVKANIEDPTTNDQKSLDILRSLYPTGQLRMFDSDIPGHDFWIFFVPSN